MEYSMTKVMAEKLLKDYGGAMDKSLNKYQKLAAIINENFGLKDKCTKIIIEAEG